MAVRGESTGKFRQVPSEWGFELRGGGGGPAAAGGRTHLVLKTFERSYVLNTPRPANLYSPQPNPATLSPLAG